MIVFVNENLHYNKNYNLRNCYYKLEPLYNANRELSQYRICGINRPSILYSKCLKMTKHTFLYFLKTNKHEYKLNSRKGTELKRFKFIHNI